jgi:hypothetical protein
MADIKAMTDDWITPATAAKVMKMDVSRLIQYAREGQLPFAVQISGNRVKISRRGFLQAYGYGDDEEKAVTLTQDINKRIEILSVLLEKILEEIAKWRRGL